MLGDCLEVLDWSKTPSNGVETVAGKHAGNDPESGSDRWRGARLDPFQHGRHDPLKGVSHDSARWHDPVVEARSKPTSIPDPNQKRVGSSRVDGY